MDTLSFGKFNRNLPLGNERFWQNAEKRRKILNRALCPANCYHGRNSGPVRPDYDVLDRPFKPLLPTEKPHP
jgi:hypothetical protein